LNIIPFFKSCFHFVAITICWGNHCLYLYLEVFPLYFPVLVSNFMV
jgi:hypothetical protein